MQNCNPKTTQVGLTRIVLGTHCSIFVPSNSGNPPLLRFLSASGTLFRNLLQRRPQARSETVVMETTERLEKCFSSRIGCTG